MRKLRFETTALPRRTLVVVISALALTVVAALVQGSPILGDRSQPVNYHNSTATTVDLYIGGRQDTGTKRRLEPGETFADSWPQSMLPTPGGHVRVLADDANGLPLFCRDISFEELVRTGWRIDVAVTSQPEC